MIYGNNNLYPNYQVPYVPNIQPNQQVDNNSNILWVQGEGGAKSYPVRPGTSQVLFDSESQTFYIKTVDTSGMPQPLRMFSYSECSEADRKQPEIDTSMFITRNEFEDAMDNITRSLKKQNNGNNGNNERRNNNGKSLIPRTNE